MKIFMVINRLTIAFVAGAKLSKEDQIFNQ